jgi:cyclase
MPATHYSKGLHELGNGQYAYLQPSGTWGFSNAGLIVDGEESLLVDTLFDERLTGEMLDVMRDATGLGHLTSRHWSTRMPTVTIPSATGW